MSSFQTGPWPLAPLVSRPASAATQLAGMFPKDLTWVSCTRLYNKRLHWAPGASRAAADLTGSSSPTAVRQAGPAWWIDGS